MKARLRETQQASTQIVLLNNHQYSMGWKQLKTVLQTAKDKFRKEKQTAIYAVTKGNVTQMLNEPYANAEELRKAIAQYKCKGFHNVYYYLAV